jgi:hypothetical protein
MRRGLGFKLARHEAALREFVLFLARKRTARITVNLALEWATQTAEHQPYEWAARVAELLSKGPSHSSDGRNCARC